MPVGRTTVVLLAGATSNSLRTVVFSFLLFTWNISHLKLWKATFTCPMLLKRLKKPSLTLIKTEILYFLLLAVEFSVYFKCWGLFRNISNMHGTNELSVLMSVDSLHVSCILLGFCKSQIENHCLEMTVLSSDCPGWCFLYAQLGNLIILQCLTFVGPQPFVMVTTGK